MATIVERSNGTYLVRISLRAYFQETIIDVLREFYSSRFDTAF